MLQKHYEDFFLQYYFSNVAAVFLKYFQQKTQIESIETRVILCSKISKKQRQESLVTLSIYAFARKFILSVKTCINLIYIDLCM